jgi:dipeptidyl aminopeptidase/acylaminoacyl peptidase
MPSPTSQHPVAPEDLFRLAILQTARLSPDGRSMVYAVATVDAEEQEHVALWVQSLETGAARQLTAGRGCDTSPEWSPDGRQIAFSSTRDGKAQIYLIPVDGGEARALTALEQGVGGGPIWSPDGSQIAFTAAPAPPPDLSKPYQVGRHVYRFDALGYLDGAIQSLYILSVDGGEPQRLTNDDQHASALGWSPDGTEILVLSTMRPDIHDAYHGQLRAVSLAGDVRELTAGWGYATSAAWTPDGRRVVFYGVPSGRPIGTKNDVWVVDRAGGAPECRTATLVYHSGGALQDDMAVELAPRVLAARDGRSAYAQVQVGGTVQIYRVALTGPEECAVVVGGERACFPFDVSDRHLLFGASTLTNPFDLYLTDLANGEERQITRLNAAVIDEWAPVTVEPLQFSGSDGAPVEGWLMRPPVGAAPYPTVLYIHGGPHSGFGQIFSFDFQMLAGAGYAVLFVNQRGSTGYGDAFATAIKGDWGNLDYHDLMAGVDAAIARGLADPERLGVCGLSGGGNLSCWVVGQTNRFKAAVPENPVTNWVSFYGVSDIGPWFAVEELGGRPHEIPEIYQRCSPITYAHRCTTPTLLIQGEADYRCPAEQAEQFYAVLKASGCTVEMLRFPGGAHAASITGIPAIRKAHNEALLGWMNRYVLSIG